MHMQKHEMPLFKYRYFKLVPYQYQFSHSKFNLGSILDFLQLKYSNLIVNSEVQFKTSNVTKTVFFNLNFDSFYF